MEFGIGETISRMANMNNSEKDKRANLNFMKPCCKQHNVFN